MSVCLNSTHRATVEPEDEVVVGGVPPTLVKPKEQMLAPNVYVTCVRAENVA
jgi:hypothetical protein